MNIKLYNKFMSDRFKTGLKKKTCTHIMIFIWLSVNECQIHFAYKLNSVVSI